MEQQRRSRQGPRRMTPEESARLGRVEERISGGIERITRLEERVADTAEGIRRLVPLVEKTVMMDERLAVVGRRLDHLEEDIRDRDETTRKERREGRIALWSLTATIVAALIVATVTVLTTLH